LGVDNGGRDARTINPSCLTTKALSLHPEWVIMIETRQALVFDYDGVIADTEPLHWKAWETLLSQNGIQLGWDEYCRVGQGVSDRQIYEHFRARMPRIDANAFSILNADRRRNVRELSLRQCPVPLETIALLKSLDGYKIGLVTSSEQSEVEPVLYAAGIHMEFDAIVFGGDTASKKPSPAPYLLIAEKLGVKTGIAFEDSEPGLSSARAAGFRAVKIARPSDLSEIVKRSLR
jgi:beta-phosphoglucomutase